MSGGNPSQAPTVRTGPDGRPHPRNQSRFETIKYWCEDNIPQPILATVITLLRVIVWPFSKIYQSLVKLFVWTFPISGLVVIHGVFVLLWGTDTALAMTGGLLLVLLIIGGAVGDNTGNGNQNGGRGRSKQVEQYTKWKIWRKW